MPRTDVSLERKNQILDTAAAVFAQRGFHQARMDDIVAASGLSKGAIYWYFKSKDEIILALMERLFRHELEDLHRLAEATGPAAQRLIRAMSRVMTDVEALAQQGLLPLFYEFFGLATRQEEVRDVVQTYLHTYRTALTPIIRQGIERGEFRPVDPAQVVVMLAALIDGLTLHWTIDAQSHNLVAQTRASVELIVQGLSLT